MAHAPPKVGLIHVIQSQTSVAESSRHAQFSFFFRMVNWNDDLVQLSQDCRRGSHGRRQQWCALLKKIYNMHIILIIYSQSSKIKLDQASDRLGHCGTVRLVGFDLFVSQGNA